MRCARGSYVAAPASVSGSSSGATPQLRSIASPTQVELHEPDGTVRYIVGPLPQWAKRGRGAELVNRYHAQVTPATSQLRRLRQWPPVLIAMLRARGVTPLHDE